jgi:hypothetical protein
MGFVGNTQRFRRVKRLRHQLPTLIEDRRLTSKIDITRLAPCPLRNCGIEIETMHTHIREHLDHFNLCGILCNHWNEQLFIVHTHLVVLSLRRKRNQANKAGAEIDQGGE